jgi:hypothetical protein
MQKLFCLLVTSLILFGLVSANPPGERSFQITAMVYETPPTIVTTVWGGPDGKGGISGGQIGGMVTSQFPDGTVFLKLGGPADFTDDAIKAAIKKNFVFRCGNALSQELPADFIGKIVYFYQGSKLMKTGSGTILTDKLESRPLDSRRLNLDLISKQNDRWIFGLKFEVAEESDNLLGKWSVLLDQYIGVRAAEPILIGFPFIDSKKGKFIYWVAMHIEVTGT